MTSYRIPEIGEVMIEEDGDTPFIVTDIDDGDIIGETPDGRSISLPIESEPHLIDGQDL
jgi:hypothetical protein